VLSQVASTSCAFENRHRCLVGHNYGTLVGLPAYFPFEEDVVFAPKKGRRRERSGQDGMGRVTGDGGGGGGGGGGEREDESGGEMEEER
jgi:hypothetical protein